MKEKKLAIAKTPSVEPSNFIGKSGFYLSVKEGFEENSDLDSITVEKGICKGFLNDGLYCTTNDGQKATWFPSVYLAVQAADDLVELWEFYDFEKPLVLSLSDEISQIYDDEMSKIYDDYLNKNQSKVITITVRDI